jgi:hypothetical protein
MKTKCLLFLFFAFSLYNTATAQNKTEVKQYPRGYAAGEVSLLQQWAENDGRNSFTVYMIEAPVAGVYHAAVVANLQNKAVCVLGIDNQSSSFRITATGNGWQKNNAVNVNKNGSAGFYLSAGKHSIRLSMPGNMPPLVDEISFSRTTIHSQLEANWQKFSTRLQKWADEQPVNRIPSADKGTPAETSRVLSNPQGNYEHAIDTAYSYSTFQWLYLNAGTTYTFSTYGSTKDPVLHLFDPANIDARSWASDDYNGTWESNLAVTIPVTGYYNLLARPYFASQNGTTNIKQNGVDLLVNTPIGGERFFTTGKSGELNYFTAKASTGTAYAADTRIFTMLFSGSAVSGYNDDYYNTSGGTWNWGLASRIKKNYTSASYYAYVCAYSTSGAGKCDVYLENGNATIPTTPNEAPNFPLLKGEDAIQGSPHNGDYNCISWSGGFSSGGFQWPPDYYSSWYVAGNPLASFDKFYANTPVRYPGAMNYTRTGATAANAAVDLWKTTSVYTHASVTKPGNSHPHGYDWESKPGSFDRTMHPRNALNNASWYGFVNDYYKPTGSFARMAGVVKNFATDTDAIKAGVAVFDKAALTTEAQDKLRLLVSKTDAAFARQFNELYDAWNKTKTANASMSNPELYCKNTEFETLASFAKKNPNSALVLAMDKFVNQNDHIIGQLLWTLTNERYSKLLDEVKTERAANPNDEQGRYKIHGDHDNGILYVEKILKDFDLNTEIKPLVELVQVNISPNPVKDWFSIKLNVTATAKISVKATSAQTRAVKILQPEKELAAGNYEYKMNATGFAGSAGDMITVQVMVNGVIQTVKAMVVK